MGEREADHAHERRRAHEGHGADATTMRLPRPPRREHASREARDVEGVEDARVEFAQAVHAGVEDEHGETGGRQELARTISTLSARDARVQLRVLSRLASEGHPVMERISVPIAGTFDRSIDIFASDLPELVAVATRRSAELEASTDPSFEGLTQLPPEQRGALTALARRYLYGGGQLGVDGVLADMETFAGLLAGFPSTQDPLSRASLLQLANGLRRTLFALQDEQGSVIRPDDGRGETIEQFQARQRRYLEAGRQIQQGLFAGLLFQISYLRTGDFDRATRMAGVGAACDGVLGAMGAVFEGRQEGRSPAAREADGSLPRQPTVVGLDGGDMPPMAQPVHPPGVTELPPTSQPSVPRGREQRARQTEHARRLDPRRR